MYVYEGKDYSKASESDKKTFGQLLAGELHVRTLYMYLPSWATQ